MATPVWIDGAEHGVATLVTSGTGLFDAVNGSPSTQSTTKNTGTYAYQFNTSATTAYLQKNFASNQTTVVGRLYFRYGTLPNSRTEVVMHTGSVISGPRFMFLNTDAKIYIAFGSTGGTASTGTFTTGQWYRLDWRIVISGTTGTIDWQIDGTAQTQHVDTGLASGGAMSQTRIGFVTSTTGNMYIDDCVISYTSADYPLGPGGTEWLAPTGEGTHSIAANTLEDAAGSDINGTSVLAYAQIDELPISESTTRIQQNGADNNSYFEVTLANISATHSAIIGGMAYLAYQSASATANNGGFTASKDSFSTETTVWGSQGSLADYSESSMFYKSAIVAGVTDDTTANALKFRGGWSSDATPDPYWYNAGVQLAYTTSTAQTVNLTTAALTATGRASTITPGAVTKTLNTAALTATGRAISVSITTQILLATAQLLATGNASTITPGAVTKALQTAALIATGNASTITPGAVTKALQTAALSAIGQALVVTPGAVTKTLQTASLVASGQAAAILPGAVTIALQSGTLTATGQVISVGSFTIVNLNTASLVANGQALTVSPGAVSVLLNTAQMQAAGIATTIIPGAVIVALNTAQALASGISITVDATGASIVIPLATAQIIAQGISSIITPGAVSTQLQTALLSASGINAVLQPGAVVVPLDTALITASGQAVDIAELIFRLYANRYQARARRDVSVEARTTHEAGTRRDQAAEEREDNQAKPRRTFKSDGL